MNGIQRINTLLNHRFAIKAIKKLGASISGFSVLMVRLSLAAFLVCGFGFIQESHAQIEVSGTVTDADNGSTLPGVNVTVKGMPTRGTSTDENGDYSLIVPSPQDTLVFSFIGYTEKQVPVNGRTTINVQMVSQVVQSEGLVVTGFGTQEQQQVTGSISTVDSEEFVGGNVNNVSELLSGKVAGLAISSSGANPNSSPTIRLRGISSFGANQEPLVVVDGVPGASMNNVDPSDIQSINVLKDASASAIYGTRGSAGVIVITTKSGHGGFSVSYEGSYTMETVANKLDVLSATEYKRLAEVTGFNAPMQGHSTDWFERISQVGANNIQNLSFSGGNDNMNYRVSLNYRNRKGIQRETGFEKINGRLNFTQWAVDKKLQFDVNLSATDRQARYGFSEAFRYAAIFNPTAPVFVGQDSMPTTGGYFEQPLFDYFNPVNIIESGERRENAMLFNGNLKASYEFRDSFPGLRVSATYSLATDEYTDRNFYARTHKFIGGASSSSLGPGLAEKNMDDSRDKLFQAQVNYTTDIQDLSIESFVGYQWQEFIYTGTFVGGGDFVTDAVKYNNFTFAQDFNQGEGTITSYKNTHRLIGFYGRTNLNWDQTYFLNGSIRREGSSRFGADNKWGLFWSTGVGVELTNLVDIPLDQLKFRASYGLTGQDAPFSGIAVQRYAPQGNFFLNGRYIQSFGPVSNANPNLKWEEKAEFNVGFDYAALDHRLSGSLEYYTSTVSDLLFEISVPVPPNLYPTTWKNVGKLNKWGIEAQTNWAVLQNREGLNWTTTFTGSYFSKTTLEEFITDETQYISNAGSPGLNATPLIRVKEGEPVGQIWAPEFAGISDAGRWLFYGKDGNKITADQVTTDDKKVVGNGLPDYQIGWSNRLNYKNWSFGMSVRGVFGHQLANMFRTFYQPPSQITSYNALDSAFELKKLKESPQFSSLQVENADFLRVEEVTLGYTIPLGEQLSIKNMRVSLSVNNLYTFTAYNGINPEVEWSDGLGGPLAPGIERRNSWYTSRSFTFSLSLDL